MLASLCSAADFISIPLDCKGLQASGTGQQRIEVPAAGFSVIPPQRRELVREVDGFGRVHFLQTSGKGRNPYTASDAERFVPSGASNSSIHGDRCCAPGVWNALPVA